MVGIPEYFGAPNFAKCKEWIPLLQNHFTRFTVPSCCSILLPIHQLKKFSSIIQERQTQKLNLHFRARFRRPRRRAWASPPVATRRRRHRTRPAPRQTLPGPPLASPSWYCCHHWSSNRQLPRISPRFRRRRPCSSTAPCSWTRRRREATPSTPRLVSALRTSDTLS